MSEPKIYFYNVGYHSFEESPRRVLYSQQAYTEDQFRDLVSDVSVRVLAEEKDLKYGMYQKFEHIMDKVCYILIADYGFKELEVQASFMPFGWASLVDPEDWASEVGSNDDINIIRRKAAEKGIPILPEYGEEDETE